MKIAQLLAVSALLFAPAAASGAPPSGLMLGVNVFQNWKGLRVVSTIPGYAADGVLFSNDVIMAMADANGVYSTRSLWQLEHAKDRIGPFEQAAIKVYRPGWGEIYFFVSLEPVGGVAAMRSAAPVNGGIVGGPVAAPQPKMQTRIRRSSDAARLFNKAPAAQPLRPRPLPGRGVPGRVDPIRNPKLTTPIGKSLNPADFFNR